MIVTIIPWPHINSASINPEEMQISSLKVPLFIEVVMAKICPRVCSVLETMNMQYIKESNWCIMMSILHNNGTYGKIIPNENMNTFH